MRQTSHMKKQNDGSEMVFRFKKEKKKFFSERICYYWSLKRELLATRVQSCRHDFKRLRDVFAFKANMFTVVSIVIRFKQAKRLIYIFFLLTQEDIV